MIPLLRSFLYVERKVLSIIFDISPPNIYIRYQQYIRSTDADEFSRSCTSDPLIIRIL